MTTFRSHRSPSRSRAVLVLAVIALVVIGCNPFAPSTPAPQGHAGAGSAAVARAASR